jgi:uncharacterized protein (TIGR03435 family)
MHNAALVVVIAMVPVMAAAQQFLAPPAGGAPVDPDTRFEVIAIRPADEGSGMMLRMTPTGFEATGVPISVLLRQALQKPDYQIVGLPGWANSERYSIRAKAPEAAPLSGLSVLLTNLLKDRFQLAMHVETRELPIFHLVVARADGRLGPDLKGTPAECQATIAERAAAAKAGVTGRAGGPLPSLPSMPGPNDPLPCGMSLIGPGTAAGSGRTIAQLVPTLADLVGRPVIDKTGLTGLYDFSLKYAPDGRYAGPFTPPPGAPAPPVDPNLPGLTTAVQEQLGLKLEGARGPVEVVIIDKFEKPTLDQ